MPVLPSNSGRLSMVATPIGNLEDLSPRARRILGEADLVLAEDTRVARSLYQALGIETRGREFERCDRYRETSAPDLAHWAERVRSGGNLVFVSDAGTPGISDPGAAVAARFRQEGLAVEVVPGPSAIAAFLSGAGFVASRFRFCGFFPRNQGDRQSVLGESFELSRKAEVCIWFEAPGRIGEVLEVIDAFAGAESRLKLNLVAAKEISKIHEYWLAGSPSQVLSQFRTRCIQDDRFASGEWILGIERVDGLEAVEKLPNSQNSSITQELMSKILDFSAALPLKGSELAKAVSQAFGVDRDVVYRELLVRRKKDE